MNTSSNLEDAELGLPCSYCPETIRSLGLGKLVELEADLRRADCNDKLDRVHDLLGAKALTIKFKNENIRGEIQTTKAEAALQAHTDKIHNEQWLYNNSRNTLIRLGATSEDLKIHRRLKNTDLKYLKDFSEKDSRAPGQGYMAVPLIWMRRSEIFADENSWLAQTMKVEWFCARERFKRWEEELKLLKREMVMSYRSFKTYESIWKFKADSSAGTTPIVPGSAEYALARSDFFGRLADGVIQICLPHIKDSTVTVRWCSDWLSRDLSDPADPNAMEDWDQNPVGKEGGNRMAGSEELNIDVAPVPARDTTQPPLLSSESSNAALPPPAQDSPPSSHDCPGLSGAGSGMSAGKDTGRSHVRWPRNATGQASSSSTVPEPPVNTDTPAGPRPRQGSHNGSPASKSAKEASVYCG
ncbi:hypothetical protein FRC06_000161 [Ceratobasidium sp. 370]|nr:hypothetical protein FRC06_000161 [Ceratobasidium sp. 370]